MIVVARTRPPRRLTAALGVSAACLLAAGCEPGGLLGVGSAAAVARPRGGSASGPAPASASAYSSRPVAPENAEELIDQVLDDVNRERASAGLPALATRAELTKLADAYAERLIARDFFAHIDPLSGATLAARARTGGYVFFKVGENLAAGQRDADSVMKDWMASATHRANILDPDFTEIGISVRDGGKHGRYWVLEFGRPLGE